MSQYTPEQNKRFQSWAEERDNLLREIGIYSTQLNELKKNTISEGQALADLHRSISEARGRLAEITALEDRHKNSLSKEIADLEIRKSHLESECVLKESEIKFAEEKYNTIITDTVNLSAVHEKMKDQAQIINSVVGDLVETTRLNTSNMKVVMSEIKVVVEEVILKGNENIKQTGIILEKLPKYIFELQKPIPVRRLYSAQRGTVINPDKK